MTWLQEHLLSLLIFMPSIGALLILCIPDKRFVRRTALTFTLITFLLSLLLLVTFDWKAGKGYDYLRDPVSGTPGVVQLVQRVDWIKALNIQYLVGIDGLSFPLVLLTTFISALACVASWNTQKMTRGYFALLLFLETGILGVFLSLDMFLFYVFFELSLLPMYFLIGIWGGSRKEYAAIKFFLYTLVGSIGLLVALIATYLYSRQIVPATADHVAGTFDLVRMASRAYQSQLGTAAGMSFGAAKLFFCLLMLGFLIKLPAVPFHTWLPDAHVEAPTPVSMILAALLLKMGGYGMLRVAFPLFPEAAKALWLPVAIIGVVSIIYGALCAMSQRDFKRLVAYSSVSHMGFVTLGAAMMTTAALNGAIFMMVAHGITSAMLFFIVGVVYDRAHHREMSRLGGLASTMPVYTGLAMIGCFANLGLPALCGFVGEVMVLLGSFAAGREDSILRHGGFATPGQIYPLAIIACCGIVLTAGYMLWTIQRVYLGPEKQEYKNFREVDSREVAVLGPLAVMAILLGCVPSTLFFIFTDSTVAGWFRIFR